MKMKKESNFVNKLLIMFCSLLVMASGMWYSGYKKESNLQIEEESYEMVFKKLSEEVQKPPEDVPEIGDGIVESDEAETPKEQPGPDASTEEGSGMKVQAEGEPSVEGEPPAASDPQPDVTGDSQDKININTATAAELTALPGIGEVLAGRIVEYRKQHGAFQSLEDIKNVDGIGEKKFEGIKESISI